MQDNDGPPTDSGRLPRELEEKIELHVSRLFRDDAAKHREYLDKSMDHLKWAIAVLAAAFVFWTSYTVGTSKDSVERANREATSAVDKASQDALKEVRRVAGEAQQEIKRRESETKSQLREAYASILDRELEAQKDSLVRRAIDKLEADVEGLSSRDAIASIIRGVLTEEAVVSRLKSDLNVGSARILHEHYEPTHNEPAAQDRFVLHEPGVLLLSASGSLLFEKGSQDTSLMLTLNVDDNLCARDRDYSTYKGRIRVFASATCVVTLNPGEHEVGMVLNHPEPRANAKERNLRYRSVVLAIER